MVAVVTVLVYTKKNTRKAQGDAMQVLIAGGYDTSVILDPLWVVW